MDLVLKIQERNKIFTLLLRTATRVQLLIDAYFKIIMCEYGIWNDLFFLQK